MSCWSYVNSVVKINSTEPIKDFFIIFGKECLWESPNETWDDAYHHPDQYLPIGSEGSLYLKSRLMTRIPSSKYPYRYKITIEGSLRDFTSWKKLISWFEKSLQKIPGKTQISASINAECDYNGVYNWSHTDYGYKDPFFYK